MKTIALFDFNWHGHHPTYLFVFAGSLIQSGHRVVLFCQKSGEIIEQLKETVGEDKINSACGVDIFPPQGSGKMSTALFQSWVNWKHAANLLDQFQKTVSFSIDAVFFLKLEDYTRGFLPLKQIDQIFPFPWGGLFIHLDLPFQANPKFFKDRRLLVRHFLKTCLNNFSILNSKWCQFVGSLQENCLGFLAGATQKPVLHFPEITHEQCVASSKLVDQIQAQALGRKIITLAGLLDRRKGVFTFLEAAKRSQERDWFFVCCGSVQNFWSDPNEVRELRDRISQYEGRNIFVFPNKIADEKEFNKLIQISDVVFAGYENFPPYSSNILTKTAMYQKPVIVNADSLLESRVRQFRIGDSFPQGDVEACILALERVLNCPIQNPGYHEYFQRNSQHYFKQFLSEIITKID